MTSGFPNDQRRFVTLRYFPVIASEAKQSISRHNERMDCFASLAMTGIGRESNYNNSGCSAAIMSPSPIVPPSITSA
jgi:hypothetical protein